MIEPRSITDLLKEPNPDAPKGKKPVRLLACGVPEAVEAIIHSWHVTGFAEVGEWSHPMASPIPGEVIRILTRYIILGE